MSPAHPAILTPRRVRIIHLEDNPLDQELVAAMLARNGIVCEFVYAEDRATFQAVLERERADLIISDFSLPGYDGARALEVARQLRGDVPFIFFSGTLGEEAAVESLKNGATDYVLKQRPERLVAAVRRALADADARAARERIEEELRQRDALFRKILENVEDLVTVVDLEGRLTLSSPSHRQLFGQDAPGVGDDFLLHAHADDRGRIRTAFQRTILEDMSSRVEYRLVVPGDGLRMVEAHGSVMHNERGQAPSVLWVARDITGRRVAEERILEQAALLDEARDAICVTDLEQRILFWNKSAERLYGWAVKEALGRNANELLCQSEVALAALKTLIQCGEWHGELQHTTRAGARLIVESRWTLIRAGETPKSILVINTDITERKEIEAQFLRAQRMESIGALAGGIAHDLNNVLGPIMMAVEVIQNDPLNEGNAGLLELVGTSARRGSEMVKQILSFARGVSEEKVPLQIPQLVAEVVKLAGDTFSHAISVRSAVPGDLPAIQGDATQLHQVLLNLCVNARDAMPQGGTLTIEATVIALQNRVTAFQAEPLSGPFIQLKVTDTGTGIPPEALPRIFEPFFTTKDPGKGTGLGLSTVLKIVRGHGGFVEVASEAGTGTTFLIYLPVLEESAALPGAAEVTSPPQGRNERLLVVDDEAAILEITRATLGAFNYQVLTAKSGGEALAIFSQTPMEIDLVITDLRMSSMGGLALVEALRSIQPDLRIIAVSGLPPERAADYPPGIKAFLKKPYTMTTLLTTIRAVLDA